MEPVLFIANQAVVKAWMQIAQNVDSVGAGLKSSKCTRHSQNDS